MEWILKQFGQLSPDELYEIIKLRIEVFIVEQDCHYQDLDDKDQLSYHLFLKDNDEIIAVLRILPENVAYDEMSIGRVIVKKTHRGHGIAKCMIKRAMDFIVDELGKDSIRLSGQAYLTDFYIGLGFKKVSGAYLEDGIKHYQFLYTA
ncbi:GNAT family N-acetyltransferase [Methanobrevibacter sp.]